MKRWYILVGVGLVVFSAALYLLHYAVFGDPHHIWIYLLGDIAFVPVEVLLVTLILHRLLEVREKRALLHKLNMVIGVFFSEVGNDLMRLCLETDADRVRASFSDVAEWSDGDFVRASCRFREQDYNIEHIPEALEKLKAFLVGKRAFLLRLLENPNILEHDTFTDLLWAVFHLTEELAHRRDVRALPQADRDHLTGDINRAYGRLVAEWILYMRHLKRDYPYLFSLAARTNPFNPGARAEVV